MFSGQIIVKPLKANLKRDTATGSMDPYCIVFFGQEKHMTNVHHSGGKTPSWNSVFKTRISNFSESIRVQVWDKDTFSADNMIGEGFISIEKVALGQGVQVHNCVLSYKQYSNTGEVTFEIEWFPDGVQMNQQVYMQQQPYQQQGFQKVQQQPYQQQGFQQQQPYQQQGFQQQNYQQQQGFNQQGFQQQPYQQNQGFNQGFQQQQPYQQQGFQQQQPYQQQGYQQQGFNQQQQYGQQGFQQQNYQQQQNFGQFQQQPNYQQGFQQGFNQGFQQQNFVVGQRFQTWTYKCPLSRQEIKKHCKKIFKKYDRDRSRYLDEQELYGAIQEFFSYIGYPAPPIEILWDLMDIYSYRGGRCKVNKKQFRTIVKELCGVLNENQRQKRHKNRDKFFF